jgi:hypothetical protein
MISLLIEEGGYIYKYEEGKHEVGKEIRQKY